MNLDFANEMAYVIRRHCWGDIICGGEEIVSPCVKWLGMPEEDVFRTH